MCKLNEVLGISVPYKVFNGDVHIVPNGKIQRVTNECKRCYEGLDSI